MIGIAPSPSASSARVRGVELSLAAVDHDEIGQRLLLVHAPREVARHDFVHRREVVDAFDRLHLELAILGAVRPAVLEPHARRDGVGALRVRDVEAHERARNFLQPELPLQLVNGIARALLGLVAREPQLLEQVPRVLRREVDELAPRTALRRVRSSFARATSRRARAPPDRTARALRRPDPRAANTLPTRYASSTAASVSSATFSRN